MSYQLTANSSIRRLADGAIIPVDLKNSDYRDVIAWCEAGGQIAAYVTPSLTPLECLDATQVRLDSLAKAWGYDSMLSLVSYCDSLVPRFAAEAIAGRDFRDATWSAVVVLQDQLVVGTVATPSTIGAYFELLPAIPSRPVV
jgi:hypothetical protein